MIGLRRLVGLYVQPDEERVIQGQCSLVPGFAVEVIEVEGHDKPVGGRVFEGRTFGLTRCEKNHPGAYRTPLREAIRPWWEVETYGAPVPEELFEAEQKGHRPRRRDALLAEATLAPTIKPDRGAGATAPPSEQANPRERS